MRKRTGLGISDEVEETAIYPFNPTMFLLLEDLFFLLLEDGTFLFLE